MKIIKTDFKKLFKQECTFLLGTNNPQTLPKNYLPEVAFFGRSNVGKSSIINALVGQKELARVSKTPGRTREINFFLLHKKINLVDLPGYGYAEVSKKIIKEWKIMLHSYFINRAQLKRVFLLIDARHGFKKNDLEIMEVLDHHAINYQIILTKLDKLTKAEAESNLANISEMIIDHPAMHPIIISTSSKSRVGIKELQLEIASFL